jgi:hypothetical protein
MLDVKRSRGAGVADGPQSLLQKLWPPARVTRWVCEKIAQNIAQPIFLCKLINKFNRGKSRPKTLGYFCNIKNSAQSKHSYNSRKFPNQVTLPPIRPNLNKDQIGERGRERVSDNSKKIAWNCWMHITANSSSMWAVLLNTCIRATIHRYVILPLHTYIHTYMAGTFWPSRNLLCTSSIFIYIIRAKVQKCCCWSKLCNVFKTALWSLGSMLWSQFSAIFDNFRRKNWRFSQKPMLWSKFCIF